MSIVGLKYANGMTKDVFKRDFQSTYLRPTKAEPEVALIFVFRNAWFQHKCVSRKNPQEGYIILVSLVMK